MIIDNKLNGLDLVATMIGRVVEARFFPKQNPAQHAVDHASSWFFGG